MTNYSIVIAYPDSALRDLFTRNLNRQTYDVRTATNGEEAMVLIETAFPHLLILDINMPVLDGFEVLAQLPPARRPFPVLVLTNDANRESRYRSTQLGADEYLFKADTTIVSFVQTVEWLLRQGRGAAYRSLTCLVSLPPLRARLGVQDESIVGGSPESGRHAGRTCRCLLPGTR
jgi:two-component system phosphate regulon response regulator PhoB